MLADAGVVHRRRRPPGRPAGGARRAPSGCRGARGRPGDRRRAGGRRRPHRRRRATGRTGGQQRRVRHQRRLPRARPGAARRGDRGQRGGADAPVARRAVGDAASRSRLAAQRVERRQLPAGTASRRVRRDQGLRDEPHREPARGGAGQRRARHGAVPRADAHRVPERQQHRSATAASTRRWRGRASTTSPAPGSPTSSPTRRSRCQACSTR